MAAVYVVLEFLLVDRLDHVKDAQVLHAVHAGQQDLAQRAAVVHRLAAVQHRR
jgi:hypothetical protein